MADSYDHADDAGERRWTRGWIALSSLVLVLVCGIVLPPLVNANRFRARLARDLSAALGRPVQMENVRLRLLPRPGFDFENFEVDAEPGFGAEPVVRAAKVTVGIRLLPLWRGRIEVATVSLQDASLNIARTSQGEWNFAGLLERTAQLPARLPAAQPRSGAHAQFPYFEVTNGRINFKRGEEKLPFSLTDADFSLWLAGPADWRLRFRATPVRTDLNAAYTGDLRLEGSVHTVAAGLADAQVSLAGSWRHAPLGQLGRMLTSEDRGWRGDASINFTLLGKISAATAHARVNVDGLRREDFVPGANVAMDADCTASLDVPSQAMSNAACTVPMGAGHILLSATSLSLERDSLPSNSIAAVALDRVPADWLLASLRLVRQGLSPDLHAGGELSGDFTFNPAAVPHLSGHARWQQGALLLPSSDVQPLLLPDVLFDAGAAAPPTARNGHEHSPRKQTVSAAASLQFGPLTLPLGGVTPLEISGAMGRRNYSLLIHGSAQLERVAPLLRALGFARWAVLHRVSGTAQADLHIQDFWMRNATTPPPSVEGSATLRNVSADTAWLPGTIRLAQAKVVFAPKLIAWQNLQWAWAGAKFDGAATRTSMCSGPSDCGWRLTAHAPALNLQQIMNVFQPSATAQLAALFRGNADAGWPLFQIDLSADTLTAGRLAISHFNAGLTASNADLKITRCSGMMLGSAMECDGSVALDRGAAQLSIADSRAGVAAAGAIFKEAWGTGVAETSVNLKLQRGSAPGGTFTAMLRDAAFNAAAASPLAHVQSWQMSGRILGDHLQLDRSLLTAAGQDYAVTGSIGFDRRLDLNAIHAGAAPRHISGTVQSPQMQ